MWLVRVAVDPDDFEQLIGELWEAGTLGVTEGGGTPPLYVEAFFDDPAPAARFGTPEPAPDLDWVAETEAAWPGIEVGERFFIAPPWSEEPTPAGRFRLVINPGLQCGTGQHPCTQKCLEALERVVKPGDRVLDVGSGSGILSLAAKFLGASQVVACDIDPEARPTPEFLQEMGALPFFIGSVDAVRSGAFDVVVANISEAVLGPLRGEFERVAPVRILSGFRNDDGDWSCVVK